MVSLTRSWFTRLPHGTDMLAQDIKLPFVPLKVNKKCKLASFY